MVKKSLDLKTEMSFHIAGSGAYHGAISDLKEEAS